MRVRVAARAVGLAVVLLAAGLPAAREAGAAASELKVKRDALGDVRRQLDDARARASAARRQEVSLLAELEGIDRDLAKKRGALGRLDRRIGQVERELAQLEGRRGRVAEETVSQQAALAARLRALGRLVVPPTPPGWLAGEPERARARAAADLGRLARLDLERLDVFEETAEQLLARQGAVARGRRELLTLRQAVDAERAAVTEQAERRRGLLASVRDDRALNERMARELEDAARRLETLVRELARRSQARRVVAKPSAPAAPRGPGVGLGAARGQLPWPAEGRIVAGFGRQVHPRFGTETIRRGIDIQAPEGAPIRAVHAGTVLYRGWLKGYGNLVVLDHGDGYYTLYGHAGEIVVDEDERVGAGQTIGRVGETGAAEGTRVYFEVRHQGRAEDPELWLRRRS
jgi:septal ring factor EnvC (AmiA/AmiB activator)